ncbi:biofilm/acid-resistance regulator YmgB/AriR [Rahnella selenatireducens]|uniref:biofilm/acid-resistance regulator YmgB/AriR n=1 Tax=Rahnella selenatireducens TaxID=3389797 RepID=UPI0039686E8C
MTVKSTNSQEMAARGHTDIVMSQGANDTHNALSQNKIYQHFVKSGELFSSETEVLGAAIRDILNDRGHVNNKAIILHLILKLESTSDVVQMDILRNTLEMVVGITPDDPEI